MSKQTPLDSDEKIAILVAFGCIGAILLWNFTRPEQNWAQSFLNPEEETKVTREIETKTKEETIISESSGLPERREKVSVEEKRETYEYTPKTEPEPQYVPIPTPLPQQQTQIKKEVEEKTTVVEETPVETEVTEENTIVEETPEGTTETEVTEEIETTPEGTTETEVTEEMETTPEVTTETEVTEEMETTPEVTTETEVATATLTDFIDVPETYWAYPFVKALQEEKLITVPEDQKFNPDGTISRAEYGKLVASAFNNRKERSNIDFKDTNSNTENQIDDAVQEKFLSGYPDETFKPTDPISRVHVLLSLVNGLELTASGNQEETLGVYDDQDDIPDYAKSAIAVATEKGLVVVKPDNKQLNPEESATRAEVAAMIYQALVATEGKPEIESEYLLKPEQ